jgi:hypothetical protein
MTEQAGNGGGGGGSLHHPPCIEPHPRKMHNTVVHAPACGAFPTTATRGLITSVSAMALLLMPAASALQG